MDKKQMVRVQLPWVRAGGLSPGRSTKAGPAFHGTYEFRIRKYLALEAGVDTMVATYNIPSAVILAGVNLTPVTQSLSSYFVTSSRANSRSTSVPFGLQGILPFSHGRGELFTGAGAAYVWGGALNYNAWVAQGDVGARFAVDKQRRFWLGTTARFSREFRYSPQTSLSWTADLGFRFGH